jgi:hypothetical protein
VTLDNVSKLLDRLSTLDALRFQRRLEQRGEVFGITH